MVNNFKKVFINIIIMNEFNCSFCDKKERDCDHCIFVAMQNKLIDLEKKFGGFLK